MTLLTVDGVATNGPHGASRWLRLLNWACGLMILTGYILIGAHLAEAVERSDFSVSKTRMVEYRYGDCIVSRHRQDAATYVLGLDRDPKNMRKILRRVTDGSCLVLAAKENRDVAMKFPGHTLRYVIADALVRSEKPILPEDLRNARTQIRYVIDVEKIAPPALNEVRMQIFLASFGECVVRANASASYALLSFSPETQGEVAAFADLASAFSDCMPVGNTVKLNKSVTRGTIAENYYRLAHASPTRSPADDGRN